MIVQRSPEWYAQRLGKATASRISDIVAKTKSGPSAMRETYMGELIAERFGYTAPNYVSGPMQWGIDHEEAARALYADRLGMYVEPAEFVDHPEIMWSGASPDGYVDQDGLVEVKCPNTSTHIATLLGSSISGSHLIQMQWQMACTGRAWCDYVSFDPRLPAAMQLHVRRVARDVSHILELEGEVEKFLAELAERVERLNGMYGVERAA
jgi:putative phage-type endonuclease